MSYEVWIDNANELIIFDKISKRYNYECNLIDHTLKSFILMMNREIGDINKTNYIKMINHTQWPAKYDHDIDSIEEFWNKCNDRRTFKVT